MITSAFLSGALTTAVLETAQLMRGSSSGDGDAFWLVLLGPAAGIGFYTWVYLRYRNTDKRYEYEHKTSSDIDGVQGYDTKTRTRHRLRNARIQGDLSRNPRERLGANSRMRIEQ